MSQTVANDQVEPWIIENSGCLRQILAGINELPFRRFRPYRFFDMGITAVSLAVPPSSATDDQYTLDIRVDSQSRVGDHVVVDKFILSSDLDIPV